MPSKKSQSTRTPAAPAQRNDAPSDASTERERALASAREIVNEMEEERSQFYALASVIADRLKTLQDEHGNMHDPGAYSLAQVLENLVSDCARANRLKEHLAVAAGERGARQEVANG
jgi:hypothetical protein